MRMPTLSRSSRLSLLGSACSSLSIALTIVAGCSGKIGDPPMDVGTGGAGGHDSSRSNTGGSGAGTSGGSDSSTGGGGGTGGGGSSTGGSGGAAVVEPMECKGKVVPGRSPLRRITTFEYNNTLRDVLYDASKPGQFLPSEVAANMRDLFHNNADSQPTSSSLVKGYSDAAADAASRATAPEVIGKLDSCAAAAATATEACARKIIESLTSRAFRRAASAAEVDELLALYKAYATSGFASGIATVIEAILQSPDFLYRLEWGVNDAAHPDVKRPSGDEMATRLSYTLWGTAPDDALRMAAKRGELDTPAGVRARATAMLEDPRSHEVVRFFFDKLLPIESLSDLARDDYPTFSPLIGAYMHEETQQFLEYEIFNNPQGGTWKSILTAPYTFLNGPLATFYGVSGVTGTAFVRAPIDTTKRKGLLLQGGVMTGTITSNESNPVLRGSFIVNKILCRPTALPENPEILAKAKIPAVNGKTARERFSAHSQDKVCHQCHQILDPVGFALENFDAVGLWRDQDNGITIDASGALPGIGGKFDNAVGMIDEIAEADETHACFVSHWLNFASGRLIDADDEPCVAARMKIAFKESGYNVKRLLLELTQSDAFLYMPAEKE
jgi:hypothetical protein